MFLILYMLDFENRKHTKFQFNWLISFRDINFLINFNMKISKCSICFRFWSKTFINFLYTFQDMYNNLFIMKSILKIIIHVLKRLQKNFEYFTSTPNAHGTFRNLHIKINLKINISETTGPIKLEFCMLSIFEI